MFARVFTKRASSHVERAREYNTVGGNTACATFRRFQPLGTSRLPLTERGHDMKKTRQDTRWIGRRIAAARRFRGWQPVELANRAGLGRRRFARYEATGDLTCDELEKL